MLFWTLNGAIVCLTILTGLQARRDREHTPLFLFLLWLLASDWARTWAIGHYEQAGTPYEGWMRVVLHADEVLYLSTTFGFAFVCGILFRVRTTRWVAVIGTVAASLVLIAGYPVISGVPTRMTYTAASIVALAACWGAVLLAIYRASPSPAVVHLAAMILVASDSVVFLYGFVNTIVPGIGTKWDAVRVANVLSMSLCSVAYLVHMLRRTRWLASFS